ncbi:hypothetical protein [Actinomadura sp. WAC 06369]|uniref:hypothetical protein n=1 Tax=Actinomadura sp. WAC 06369 TaxID=2203193 RepID=UPI000F7AC77C|nr:hypothetical protein [Actinomadura sp. WAC 06369]RSN50451.1 hypothetical protein DMH08_32750 [Actinomadura sp. WAC 06369]
MIIYGGGMGDRCDGDRTATNNDDVTDERGGDGRDGDERAAWVARVVDGLGPLDARDREVLGLLLNPRP